MHLYMVLLGCRPQGRFTEQHDIFFGIAESPKALVPQIIAYWPAAKGKIHIDALREVKQVDGYAVTIVQKHGQPEPAVEQKLFFINLGGYKQGLFDEFHYKLLVAAKNKGQAIQQAKQTAFFKHTGFKGATAHIDDKYAVDVDDLYEIKDILPAAAKEQYAIQLTIAAVPEADEIRLGYIKLNSL